MGLDGRVMEGMAAGKFWRLYCLQNACYSEIVWSVDGISQYEIASDPCIRHHHNRNRLD